jgi:hypothetical protein
MMKLRVEAVRQLSVACPLDILIGGEPAPSPNRTYFNPNLPAFGLKYGPPGKRP